MKTRHFLPLSSFLPERHPLVSPWCLGRCIQQLRWIFQVALSLQPGNKGKQGLKPETNIQHQQDQKFEQNISTQKTHRNSKHNRFFSSSSSLHAVFSKHPEATCFFPWKKHLAEDLQQIQWLWKCCGFLDSSGSKKWGFHMDMYIHIYIYKLGYGVVSDPFENAPFFSELSTWYVGIATYLDIRLETSLFIFHTICKAGQHKSIFWWYLRGFVKTSFVFF